MTVSTSLLPWIDSVEVVPGIDADSTFVHVPDVATNLVFRTTADRQSDLIVVGPRTRGSYHPSKPVPVCVRVRIRPGRTRRLLGVPVDELVNRAIPLKELWGERGRRLEHALAEAHDPVAAFARLTETLDMTGDGDRTLGAAMQALSPGTTLHGRLREVADQLGVSERHLRNVFTREIGLSPKHFARIARLRHVLAQAGSRQWAQLAGDAGFFDQSHLTNDFRSLMGVSPGAYLAGRLPSPSPCATLTGARSHS